jgi:hypothetical protein
MADAIDRGGPEGPDVGHSGSVLHGSGRPTPDMGVLWSRRTRCPRFARNRMLLGAYHILEHGEMTHRN